MGTNEPKRLSVSTVAMLLVAVIFGLGNVTDNLAALGLSAIPSWLAVGVLYFVPLSLMMAELASAATSKRGGIYTYMEVGLGPTWAFVGTWAYFVSNLVYLQMVCSRTVINASLASTGRDVFEGVTWLVPFLGAALCIALTWLLFAVAGAEAAGPYVHDMRDPERSFPRAILTAAVLVGALWAMFSEVPPGTFPAFLTRQDESGTLHHALWTQAAVVCALIFVPLFSILTGLSGSDRLISLLNDLTSLALVVPYLFVSVAYVRARWGGLKAPYRMVRSTPLAVAIGVMTFALSALGYVGAGLNALDAEVIDWIYVATVYLGPWLVILLGLLLRQASLRRAAAAA